MRAPEAPADASLQFIGVRDLGDWLVWLLEPGERGVFNATGPVAAPRRPPWPANEKPG